MPKIQLTIKTTYLPTWGSYEGIRELVQNGRDAEIQHSAPMKVTCSNDTLRIENEGTTLPIKALLLGHTSKSGNSKLIGKFGEGLKLGVLALVRAGHSVKIRNGSEVWVPSIERSELFDDNVLTFSIEKGREPKNRVRVEVGGVSKDTWEKMREHFLFLNPPRGDELVKTTYGSLLSGDRYKGKVYVKGIFVQVDPELAFGYDLRDAQLDRDRRMVETWNLQYITRNIFNEAMSKREGLIDHFDQMLTEVNTEVASMQDYTGTHGIPEVAVDQVVKKFFDKHGESAVPVRSLAESKDIEHLGKKGVVVNKQLGSVLAKRLGEAFEIKGKLAKEEIAYYDWGSLSEEERSNLEGAISLINPIEPLALSDIEVVDFRSKNIMGQYKENRIFISKAYLQDRDETLCTLIHEVAHRNGEDGDQSHVNRIETIWKKIVGQLRG